MQNVHRMPLVYRRRFATSINSKSRGKGDQPPKSAFAERFGSPAQTQLQEPQAPFPAWPGVQSAQKLLHVNPLTLRPPPPNLVTLARETKDGTRSAEDIPAIPERRKPTKPIQQHRKKSELFSDCIGNASSFVNTSSFEAKMAVEPATATYRRWVLAAKDNIERFKSIPEHVERKLETLDSAIECEKGRLTSSSSSTTGYNDSVPESPAKTFSRTSRTAIVTPSGRRMLSTSTLDPPLCPPLGTNQDDRWGEIENSSRSPAAPKTPLWKKCMPWMLASAPENCPYSQPPVSGFMRRLYASWYPLVYPNQNLSFFQPAFHPSFPMLARGYATKRGSKSRMAQKQIRATLIALNQSSGPLSNSPDADSPCILIPTPTTTTELCNALRHLIQSTKPPLPLPRLISTHAQYPMLQNCDSFNILLAYSIRIAPIPYSAQIIAQLRARGVIWDKSTEQLVVRAHIQSGRWQEAIQLAEKIWVDKGISRTPLSIFTEILHFVLTRKASLEDIASMADRSWKLFPTGTNVNTIDKSPRITYNVIRILVNTGRQQHAIQLTRKLFESLECSTPANIRYCRSILCHVIRPPRYDPRYPSQPPQFHKQQHLLESFLKLNTALGLTPDASLTAALLENLFRSRRRGPIAFHALLEMRAKYGSGVEDGAVRRLIARYSIEEGRLGLARQMFERERLARLENVGQSQTLQSNPTPAPWAGRESIPTQSHLEYLRNAGREKSKWVVMAKRLRREEVKQGLQESELTHPKTILAADKRALSGERISPSRQRRISARAVQLRLKRGNAIKT